MSRTSTTTTKPKTTALDRALNAAARAATTPRQKALVKQARAELAALRDPGAELRPASRDGWYQNGNGYVTWRVIEKTEDGKKVPMIEWGTNPYHAGGGWGADVDVILGNKVRADGQIGGLLVAEWMKSLELHAEKAALKSAA